MSRRDDHVTLVQMRDHARETLELVGRRSKADLVSDRVLSLAVFRLLEIVGEAAGRVTPEGKAAFTGIPWAGIVGLRNRLIHGYDRVDFDRVWDVLTTDLPRLLAELDRILAA